MTNRPPALGPKPPQTWAQRNAQQRAATAKAGAAAAQQAATGAFAALMALIAGLGGGR